MQTFVPYPDFELSARCLDRQRLGKQRVETLQLIRANLGMTKGWKTHPAALMWADNMNGLIAYGVAVCDEWIARGYKDTCRAKILEYGDADMLDTPHWWGDDIIHSSHRSNLLRKANETDEKRRQELIDWYSQWGWTDNPSNPYVWPTNYAVAT